jgi:hypothetical protein
MSSFIIRVIVRRVTTVVIPMVRPRVRKKTFPFRRRRLLMDISFSRIDSIHFETEISDHGQVIFSTSARGGEIIPEDQTIGSRQESKGLHIPQIHLSPSGNLEGPFR